MLPLSTLILLVSQLEELIIRLLRILYVGVGLLEVPLLPCSRQMAVIPAFISGIVMSPLLLWLAARERLQCELHRGLPVRPVPHGSVAVLRLWPLRVQRSLLSQLWLLMLWGSVLGVSMSARVWRLSWLLEPCRRVIHAVLLLPLLERLEQVKIAPLALLVSTWRWLEPVDLFIKERLC